MLLCLTGRFFHVIPRIIRNGNSLGSLSQAMKTDPGRETENTFYDGTIPLFCGCSKLNWRRTICISISTIHFLHYTHATYMVMCVKHLHSSRQILLCCQGRKIQRVPILFDLLLETGLLPRVRH